MSKFRNQVGVTLAATGLTVGAVAALGTTPVAGDDHVAEPAVAGLSNGTAQREPRVFLKRTSELTQARRATARFRSVNKAVRAGYALPPSGPMHQCVTDYQNSGAMGFHFINEARAGDTVLDPARPEALVYHRNDAGRVRLGALEYVVFAEAWDREHAGPPVVLGQEMMLVDAPNRYELPAFYMLHAWIWKHNPAGIFSSYNARVSCHADEPPAAGAHRPEALLTFLKD